MNIFFMPIRNLQNCVWILSGKKSSYGSSRLWRRAASPAIFPIHYENVLEIRYKYYICPFKCPGRLRKVEMEALIRNGQILCAFSKTLKLIFPEIRRHSNLYKYALQIFTVARELVDWIVLINSSLQQNLHCCVAVLLPFNTFQVISGTVSWPFYIVPGHAS